MSPLPTTPMLPTHRFHELQHVPAPRRLAYSEAGSIESTTLLICLPGLLETRDVFAPLLSLAQKVESCRVITLDYCGRGASDRLEVNRHYSMSIYLDDLVEFIGARRQEQVSPPSTQMYLVGTSMGGILSMHLAQILTFEIQGLIFNDIGVSLSWWSIYGLYKDIDLENYKLEISRKPPELRIDPRAIDDVGSKNHFDLEYDYDWAGMHFERLMKNFHGDVFLIHNARSPICGGAAAHQFQVCVPALHLFTNNGATHPVRWSTEVCDWLEEVLCLKAQEDGAIQSAWVDTPLETQPEHQTTTGNEAKLKQSIEQSIEQSTEHSAEHPIECSLEHSQDNTSHTPLLLTLDKKRDTTAADDSAANAQTTRLNSHPDMAPTQPGMHPIDPAQRGSTHASSNAMSFTEKIRQQMKNWLSNQK